MFIVHNVTVHPISSRPICDGAVAVEAGKIIAVSSAGVSGLQEIAPEVAAKLGEAQLVDGSGGVLLPGIIDAHTHLGVHEEGVGIEGADYNEMTNPVTPDLRAIDGVNPDEMGITDALRGGVTSACILPGSANVIGGAAVVLHTWGGHVEKMLISQKVGMKVAFGENPKRVYRGKDKAPTTRMATAALLREWLTKAKDYATKKERAKEKGDPFDTDLKLEALLPVVNQEIPLRAHAHRADDIATAIRVAKECGVRIVIEHCTEGHKVADLLAANGVPAVVGPTMSSRSKIELREKTFLTPKALTEAGVTVALMTDHPVIPIEHLPIAAALVMKAGMPEEKVLEALTLNPARILGLDNRLGSIEAGKDADLVLWSGHPLDVQSHVRRVWIAGEQVHYC